GVAPVLLEHLRGRPLVFTRYPDGISGEWFYQKDCPEYAPGWLKTFAYCGEQRVIRFILAESLRDLAWIGNQAAIEIHPWLSSVDSIDNPDFAVFDLDPAPPASFADVIEVARAVRACLDHLGLRSYPKTSGSTGIHVYVPLKPVYTYGVTAAFVRAVAGLILEAMPGKVTLERAVKDRTGRVYIDYLQNIKGKTIAGPYVPRPWPGAPVSTPFAWDELETMDPARFHIRSVPARIGSVGDLFEPVLWDKQSLDEAASLLGVSTAAPAR
ncbi:MAG: non-homologous end-joining DNA ligase, partial [Bacillota bacterium]